GAVCAAPGRFRCRRGRYAHHGRRSRGIEIIGNSDTGPTMVMTNACSTSVLPMSPELRTTEDLERLRRSVAMLPPGQPALDREDALDLLAELQEVRRDLDRLESGLKALIEPPP